MTSALFIAGLVLVFVGLVLIVFAPKPRVAKEEGAAARALDPAEILKQVNEILGKLDQRYRIGAFVMLVGVTLISIAAFLEAQDAKDAVQQALSGPIVSR